jgi:hypothetical protein
VYAVLADFGFYNAESLEKLMAAACEQDYFCSIPDVHIVFLFTHVPAFPSADAGEFDVLLHAGDFAYDLDTNNGEIGDGYMRQLQPIIAQLPYNGVRNLWWSMPVYCS